MGTVIKHPVPDPVKPSFVIFDIRTLMLKAERQSARMSKITNDGLTGSGAGCWLSSVLRPRQHSIGYMGDGHRM